MHDPLTLRFKILALGLQIHVTDASGASVCYVKQQLFKLKEKVRVFSNPDCKELMAEIHADRIIDFSASYTLSTPDGQAFASVKRKGMQSLWRARYDVFQDATKRYEIKEGNPWAKVFDGMLEGIPLLGMLGGYFFHPYYEVKDHDGTIICRLRKQPAFLEGIFKLEHERPNEDALTLLLALIMVCLLERQRG